MSGGDADVVEYLHDDFFLHNGSNNFDVFTAAVVAGVDVDVEDFSKKSGPVSRIFGGGFEF